MTKYMKAAGVILILTLADQWTKRLAVDHLKDAPPVVLIKNVLELAYVENRGAAFGILQNRQWVFLAITILVLALLGLFLARTPDTARYFPLRLCILLIGAGAVGNMIDRMTRRYVVDFIYVKLIDFPVFNLADIYVTTAAFALALLIIAYYKEEELEGIISRKG